MKISDHVDLSNKIILFRAEQAVTFGAGLTPIMSNLFRVCAGCGVLVLIICLDWGHETHSSRYIPGGWPGLIITAIIFLVSIVSAVYKYTKLSQKTALRFYIVEEGFVFSQTNGRWYTVDFDEMDSGVLVVRDEGTGGNDRDLYIVCRNQEKILAANAGVYTRPSIDTIVSILENNNIRVQMPL